METSIDFPTVISREPIFVVEHYHGPFLDIIGCSQDWLYSLMLFFDPNKTGRLDLSLGISFDVTSLASDVPTGKLVDN